MRRRTATVVVGAVLVVALTWLVGTADVPYVQFDPGPTYNTVSADNSVISVTGRETSKSDGKLLFVTVRVRPQLTLLEALRGWWQRDAAVVPRELVIPADKTEKDMDQENKQEFAKSQSSAQTAALSELGYSKVAVDKVTDGGPSAGILKPGDIFVSVDGVEATSVQKLQELIQAKPVGTELTVAVTRDGKPQTVRVTTTKGADGKPRVGVELKVVQPHPFEIKIPVEDVGGPSAGLMLSLGIIDKLDPTDLTGGKTIAGTGTMDDSGSVGPIGGVAQKLVAAKRDGATYFLTPKDNCAEAAANAQPGLTLVKVASLHEAVAALRTIRSGGTPAVCAS